MFQYFLLFLSVTSLAGASPDSGRDRYGSPEEAALYPVAARLVGMTDWVVEVFLGLDEDVWSDEARKEFFQVVDGFPVMDDDENCRPCMTLIALTTSIIRSGASYDEIKNLTMAICYQVVPPEGYNPDQLCDLVLDTYAPHVIYVLNVTDKRPQDICTLYNRCGIYFEIPQYQTGTNNPEGRLPEIREGESGTGGRPSVRGSRPRPTLRQNQYVTILHLADIHFDLWYAENSPTDCDMPLCCRTEYNGTGSARYWGDYHCNIPTRTMELFFDFIRQQFVPDLIIYTGDTVQHTVWYQPQEVTLEVDRILTDTLREYFPGVPTFFAVGNHDMSPTNLYYSGRPEIQEMNEVYYEHWAPLSNFTEDQRVTFEKGSYYTTVPLPGLRILTYNSNYFALDNCYSILNVDEDDYTEMKQFMEDTLAAARANGEKVLLMGHHPTGGGGMFQEYSYFITDIQARYGDVIILHFLGHSHSDWFSLVRDFATGETRGIQLSSPSLTSYTDMNPSFRMILLDPDYVPIQMATYRLDIATDGNSPTPNIQFTYSHTEEYGMEDMTPASFEDFANRMEADRDLLNLYRYNKETRFHPMGSCNDNCAKNELCGIRNTDYVRNRECHDAI